jgi:hypothetical protein
MQKKQKTFVEATSCFRAYSVPLNSNRTNAIRKSNLNSSLDTRMNINPHTNKFDCSEDSVQSFFVFCSLSVFLFLTIQTHSFIMWYTQVRFKENKLKGFSVLLDEANTKKTDKKTT